MVSSDYFIFRADILYKICFNTVLYAIWIDRTAKLVLDLGFEIMTS